MQVKSIVLSLFCLSAATVYDGQRVPVTWTCKADRIGMTDWVIKISASLRPGWYIYSQSLSEGGPIPTTIAFDQTDDYFPLGKPTEQGEPVRVYDSLYKMKITSYTQRVSFIQRVKLSRPVASIHGTIDYMTCNEHLCIPNREEFTVMIQTSNSKP